MAVDWRDMFKRYVWGGINREGITFYDDIDGGWSPAEQVAIEEIDRELDAEYREKERSRELEQRHYPIR